MKDKIFGNAIWVTGETPFDSSRDFRILRGKVVLPENEKIKSAKLYAIGLGFFYAYVNGELITETPFRPLSTDFEKRENYPIGEELSGHRIYVPTFDVTKFLVSGNNSLCFYFGGGWYTFPIAKYGDAKLIYRLVVEAEDKTFEFVSSEEDKICDGYIENYYFTTTEEQNLTKFQEGFFEKDFDDSGWENAKPAKDIDTNYLLYDDSLYDTKEQKINFSCSCEDGNVKYYKCEKNISGWVNLKINGKKGDRVIVRFSEASSQDGRLDERYNHGQTLIITDDGKQRTVHPLFTWFAFQSFSVEGNAEVLSVDFIHMPIQVSSTFSSENIVLNWIYEAFINTEKCNMHGGLISDCPHIERRGYTGDGQLTGHAVMDIFNAKSFYKKWIEDISDCQDKLSGHVQYTAPYIQSGGGPGAWGCAIVEVPYQYYLHYGDKEPMLRLYPQIRRYFDYLEEHSEFGLVISDKEGEWCLGDWCPYEQVILPAPFINNYYYVRSLERAIQIAKLLNLEDDIREYEKKIYDRKRAIMAAYFNTWDGNFFACREGANAFAVDIGLGDERTYPNLVKYYQELGFLDTGICGTDMVIKVLFEHGDGALAISLLTSEKVHTYAEMMKRGATTLWENWPDAVWDRSRNHPMFGAVSAYLFDFILGIKQKAGTFGYNEIIVSPFFSKQLGEVSGSRKLPGGQVFVSYEIVEDKATVKVKKSGNVSVTFRYGDVSAVVEESYEGIVNV